MGNPKTSPRASPGIPESNHPGFEKLQHAAFSLAIDAQCAATITPGASTVGALTAEI